MRRTRISFLHNELYAARSLKKKAVELKDLWERKIEFDETTTLWREADALFEAVNSGSKEWGIPAYDGGLFARDPDVAPIGAKLSDIELSNRVFGPALRALICIEARTARASVLWIFVRWAYVSSGTIYEGLLESELSIAEEDVTVDDRGFLSSRQERRGRLSLSGGACCLRNRSGARKSSGSYFTKEFCSWSICSIKRSSRHFLITSLVSKCSMTTRRATLYSIFVSLILAMGSGHFLVAAIDRIDRRSFGGYLAKRALPGVRAESRPSPRGGQRRPRTALKDQFDIEDNRLLRRPIAPPLRLRRRFESRRCRSHSRVSIWIHTFVPGLLSLCSIEILSLGTLWSVSGLSRESR